MSTYVQIHKILILEGGIEYGLQTTRRQIVGKTKRK